ncbi:hypothetical protein [Desulfobacula sp.]|uniref:hypothetical protein n=1 Tax=Desulfobacula sp. TaxID=2593537 RepID=UPI001ECFD9DC|nr:hypothetical protein [Desulfobacula sp.]
MAGKKTTTKTNKAAKGVEITLIPNKDTPQSRMYSNFIQVTQTPYDFSLIFCDATPILNYNNTDGKKIHNIPIVAEIAIPMDLVSGLIGALQTQYDLYKDNIDGGVNAKKTSKS